MGFVTGWISNIILIILFAAVLELLLPSNSLKRYVKVVVGLMILVVMLKPVLQLFQYDTDMILKEMEEWGGTVEETGNLDELQKSEIESVSLAYISQQVAVQLEQAAEPWLKNEYNLHISDLEITFLSLHNNPDKHNIESIVVHLTPHDLENDEKEDSSANIQVGKIKIEKTKHENPDETRDINNHGIIQGLAELWEIPEELISMKLEGGRPE